MSIYDFSVKDINGNSISLDIYRGKVLLIVNTATACGFTPQYKGLEELYLKYKESGFEVLDFPCNQFGNQAKGSNHELAQFCELKYNTTFTTFARIDVNGTNADPLFQFLKNETKGFVTKSIKWNFTKFLIDRNGNVKYRFSSIVSPRRITKSIESLLNSI